MTKTLIYTDGKTVSAGENTASVAQGTMVPASGSVGAVDRLYDTARLVMVGYGKAIKQLADE